MSIPLYFTRQIKNGSWRLYKLQGQSLISWRGDNDKITTVRDEGNQICNFDSHEEASEYCCQKFGTKALHVTDVET